MNPGSWELFATKFEVVEGGCWVWRAGCSGNGYGEFWNGKRNVPAHRFAYEHNTGQVPSGQELDHLCRNRRCVNPDHLEVVDRRTNIARGTNHIARQMEMKACSQGHLYDLLNTRFWKGKRFCRTCHRNRAREAYRKVVTR